jgi:raffinose/stachyose/melibiose transport system permease protein
MNSTPAQRERNAKKRTPVWEFVVSIILVIYTFITLYLLLSTVMNSFKTRKDLVSNILGFPRSFTLDNYRTIIVDEGFFQYFLNSIILEILGLSLLIAFSSMAAYGMAQYQFKVKNALMTYFMIGLMFPLQLGILPIYMILKTLHLVNTLFGLALLYAANMSFPLFVFYNFFKAVPEALIESARIDGAGERQIFLTIIVPISKPVFSTIAILNFVTIWNDFYLPLVFLTKAQVRTMTLEIYSYMQNFLRNWNKIFAAVTIALLPIIIVYFVFSEQIVAGLTGGAVKE